MAQFDVNSTSVENIISSIKAGEIAIPEIQRPFVWDASKVRDLMPRQRASQQARIRNGASGRDSNVVKS